MIRRYLNIILIISTFFFAPKSYAQGFPMLHYTVNDGLPSNRVYYVYRDSRGFLWIATNKGVARYNGIKFEVFTTADGMPDNEIFSIQEDLFGRIWLATYNGKLCYYKDNYFHNAKNTPFLKTFHNSLIEKVFVEQDSSVTMKFERTAKMVNIAKDKLSQVYLDKDPDEGNLICVNKIANDCYKFIYRSHIKIVDTGHKEISRSFLNYTYDNKPCTDWQVSNAQDQKYIYDKHFIFNKEMKLLKNIDDTTALRATSSLYFDSKQNMFCCTDDGLYINNKIHLLPGIKSTTITQDIYGNCWISTYKDGLYVMNFSNTNACQYSNIYTGNIWYAYADNGNLFYTNSDNNFYHLRNNPGNNIVTNVLDYSQYKKGEYSNNHGFLVVKDTLANEYNYLNFYNNYIFYIQDITGNKNIHVGIHPFSEPEIVKSITDVKSQIYLRTVDKIFSIKFKHFTDPTTLNVKNILLSENIERIRAFAKSPDDEVWFSNANGVYKIIDEQDSLQHQFKDIAFNKFEFLGKYLLGYTLDFNILLVCSNIDGAVVIDTIKQNATWDAFFKIDSTHMLISTNDFYRLFTINPPGSKQAYTITAIENPFIPMHGDPFCAMCADNDFCYFFANGSITKLAINDLFRKVDPPKLFFNSLRYGGRSYLMNKELKVAYSSQKNISISFSTLSFAAKNVAYLYSVSKTEKEIWVSLKGENIDLIIPDYGKWVIKVKTRSISSAYSEPIVYTFEILPPFWATWWFNTLCIIGATTLLVIGLRYRILLAIRKTQKENETKIKFMKSEYKALNALMNPHFIFNTLNNVQSLVNRNDKLAANEYLRIFADLVRQNMHNVSKELIPLQKEIDLVDNYLALEKLRFKELMNYEIDVDDEVDTSLIMVPPLFIQPLVENSIKHGILPRQSVDSKIIVKIYEKGDVVHIEVKDNGVGLSEAKKKANALHESFGLKNIQNRVEQLSMILGKKIVFSIDEVMEEDGQWTVVSINMQV
jgi:sensor histidine kinase YesM